MKKVITLLVAIALVLSLSSCDKVAGLLGSSADGDGDSTSIDTPDRALYGVKGPVKTIGTLYSFSGEDGTVPSVDNPDCWDMVEYGYVDAAFNKEGRLIGPIDTFNGLAEWGAFAPEGTSAVELFDSGYTVSRNADGYVTKLIERNKHYTAEISDYTTEITLEWDGNRLTRRSTIYTPKDPSSSPFLSTEDFTYDADGNLASVVISGSFEYDETIKYGDYVTDTAGNWIFRSVTRSSDTVTTYEKRNITYYE